MGHNSSQIAILNQELEQKGVKYCTVQGPWKESSQSLTVHFECKKVKPGMADWVPGG